MANFGDMARTAAQVSMLGKLMGGRGRAERSYDEGAFNEEFNSTKVQKRIENEVRVRTETNVAAIIKANLEAGRDKNDGVAEARTKDNKKEFTFFLDELRDIMEEARKADTRAEVKNQQRRLHETRRNLMRNKQLDRDQAGFLSKQYGDADTGIEQNVLPRKANLGRVGLESAKNRVSDYMNMQSIVSGMVNNNPLMMGLYGVAADMTKAFVKNRRDAKTQAGNDKLKYENLELDRQLDENFEQRKEELKPWQPNEAPGGPDAPAAMLPDPIEEEAGDTRAEAAQEERQAERESDAIQQETRDFRGEVITKMDAMIAALGGDKDAKPEEEEGIMDNMSGFLGNFLGNVMGNIKRMLPMMLKGLGMAALIGSLVNGLFQGITDGWNKFVETGSITDAIFEGATSLLSGMTFGLLDKETIQTFFDDVGAWIGQKLFAMVESIKSFVAGMVDTIAEYVPGMDTSVVSEVKEKAGFKDEWGVNNTVDPKKLERLTPKQLSILEEENESGMTASPLIRTAIKAERVRRIKAANAIKVPAPQGSVEPNNKAPERIAAVEKQVNDVRNAPAKATGGDGVNQQNVIVNNSQQGGGTPAPASIPLQSRNPDSTVQRLSDRAMSFGAA